MIFFLNLDQGSPSTLEDKCRKIKFQGSRKIMNILVVKRQAAKSFGLEKKFGLTRNASVQRKTKCRRTRKNRRKSEMKRNPKKKWVRVKMKRNKERRPEQK